MKTACVILAAGKSTRMRTRIPKVLHPVCGEPMIYYPVSLAIKRRWNPVVVVVSKNSDPVRDYLSGRFGDRISFAEQDPPLGTGHAVVSASASFKGFKGKLAILYGDVPLLTAVDLGALERAGRGKALAFITCLLSDPSWYGRVVRDQQGKVLRIVEQKDASSAERKIQEINAGIYLAEAPWVFNSLKRVRRANAQGEYYLTDLVEAALRSRKKVTGVLRKDASDFAGVNDRAELARAEHLMNRRLIGKLMKDGVTVTDPTCTWLGPRVQVGRDTSILPNCHIHGLVQIGKQCRIGPGAVIRDAKIGSGVEIKAYSVLQDCVIGDGAQVGPFARLRPGTVLEDQARVGNFVEMKKSRLGRGSKANHLTYLGDTTIGEGANVGAGTITCNYDGVSKHQTIIEDGVSIGSNTQLVAPVRVGKNAVIGAGTTVTVDVPEDALAVSRVKQKNIKGYARFKRKKKHS